MLICITTLQHDLFPAALLCLSAGVIERWELLRAPKFNKDETDIKQDLEQWQKLNSDLCDVTSWLGRVLPELERLRRIAPSTSVRDFEVNIRKLKVERRQHLREEVSHKYFKNENNTEALRGKLESQISVIHF